MFKLIRKFRKYRKYKKLEYKKFFIKKIYLLPIREIIYYYI